jgi:UDP-perosamine 4-acetyltransferase
MNNVVILGGGGYARVVAEALRQSGASIKGYVDNKLVAEFSSLPYLGDDTALIGIGAAEHTVANGIGSIRVPHARRKVFDRYKNAGFSFVTVIHPSAVIASDVSLGEGAQINAGAVLQSSVRIGDNVIVNVGVVIDHDTFVGDHVHLATGAVLAGAVTVGEATMIGAGATIIQGIRIGRKALVAAGSVVIKDVPDNGRVAGVPARPMVPRL